MKSQKRLTTPAVRTWMVSLSLIILLLVNPVAAGATPGPVEPGADRQTYLPLTSDETIAGQPEAITPDALIQGMLNQVSTSTVSNYDGNLSGEWPVVIGGSPYTITTRFTGTDIPITKATQYAYEHFQSLGLATVYHYYNHPYYGQKRNVVAEQPGVTNPNTIYLVVGHLDDTSQSAYRMTNAPGADDNASGSVGVMVAADILSQYEFGATIRYVLFTGEEQGLYGSAAYAQYVHSLGENIAGVLNMDMIAWNTPNSTAGIDLYTRTPGSNAGDLVLANLFVDVINAYAIPLVPQIIQDGESASDHASFWDYGYSAILEIEDFSDFNPYYHTINDRLSTLDLPYFANFIKATIGAAAHLAGLQEGTLRGKVTDSITHQALNNVQITARLNLNQAWSKTTNSFGYYSFLLPAGFYSLQATLAGYEPYSGEATVTNGQILYKDISLNPVCSAINGLDYVYSPVAPWPGANVVFTATYASASMPLDFAWDFGGGQTGAGASISHTFELAGTYPVTLTASNCAGPVVASHEVTVAALPAILVEPQAVEANALINTSLTRTLTLLNAGHADLHWSLSEESLVDWLQAAPLSGTLAPGASSQLELTLTAPATAGVYTTTLDIASDDPSQPLLALPVTLTVQAVPCEAVSGPQILFTPANPFSGQPVTLTAQMAGGSLPIAYTWDFHDGVPPTSEVGLDTLQHIFYWIGDIQPTVTLTVTNACSTPISVTVPMPVQPQSFYLPLITTWTQ